MIQARSNKALRDVHELRWYFVGLVTTAIAISYYDRQTNSVAITAIERSIPISNQQFF